VADFYLDADIKLDLAHLLRQRRHDVVTAHEAGRRRAGDEEQLVYAAEHGRILVSHNGKDYELLQRAWRF